MYFLPMIVERGWGGLAQDKDQWRALVNTERKLQVHKMLGSS
jgi:hypothetical protein